MAKAQGRNISNMIDRLLTFALIHHPDTGPILKAKDIAALKK
jgi:hypothetical protein